MAVDQPEILVVGAGPAGSLAAILLARLGHRVGLVEQHRFSRDKVCGECISAVGVDVLQRVGLLGAIRAAGSVPITRFALHAPAGRSANRPLRRSMLGLSRLAMDELLLRAAADAGVVLRQPVRCESIADGASLRNLESNRIETVRPACILLADGSSSLLTPRPAPSGDFGLKAHFAAVRGPRDAVELFGVAGHYVGLAPVEDGLWNVAMSVPRQRLRDSPDLDELFERILHQNAGLRRRLAPARRTGPWLTCPLPRFAVRSAWPPGVIPVGNAAAAIEPIGGQGMGLALRSAELAAHAVAGSLAGRSAWPQADLQRDFLRLWRVRGWACRLAAMWISRPSLCACAASVLRGSDAVSRFVLAATGGHLAADPTSPLTTS